MSGGNERVLGFTVCAVVTACATTWAACALSCLESGNPIVSGGALRGLGSVLVPAHPARAWRQPGGPAALYWANVLFLVITIVAAGCALRTRIQRESIQHHPGDGFATRAAVGRAAGPTALARRSSILRPSCPTAGVSDLGIRLGKGRGVDCWASVEDSVVILGPPRSGKGLHLVIPSILDSPGAVVTTSTRPDNLHATLALRRQRGPVAVFDPQGLAPDTESSLRWSPITGCQDPAIAMSRAQALCPRSARGVENGSFWVQQCYTVVRCLLHAAALRGSTPADLMRWSLSPIAAEDAAAVLRCDRRAAPTWATALDAVLSTDPRQRDSVWAMVSNTFAALADPRVLASVSPDPGEDFDVADFLRAGGTLYLLGTSAGASAAANLVNALVEDVVETARRLAAAAPGGRLEPPLALVLDEAANYPLPSLLPLMSEGGGSGISTQIVLQSMAQARAKWGNDEAAAVWDTAIVKILLGGSSNAGDLRDISALAGTRRVDSISHSWGADGRRSSSSAEQEKPVLEIGTLRTFAFGEAVLLLRSAPPIRLTLEPWTRRRSRS